MLQVYYNEEGYAFSDFELDEVIEDLKGVDFETHPMILHTSTENVIYKVKVAVYKGILDHKQVELNMFGRTLLLDKTARPINGSYPSTYLDDCLNTLIGL
jgi:hypothetical protein